jgi:hypothetical protein
MTNAGPNCWVRTNAKDCWPQRVRRDKRVASPWNGRGRPTFDDAEPYGRKGWSVLVEGHATLMTYEEMARLGRNIPRPIVASPGVRMFSLRPETINGRSIGPREAIESSKR